MDQVKMFVRRYPRLSWIGGSILVVSVIILLTKTSIFTHAAQTISAGPTTCASSSIVSTMKDLVEQKHDDSGPFKVLKVVSIEAYAWDSEKEARLNALNDLRIRTNEQVTEMLRLSRDYNSQFKNADDHRESCGANLITNHGDQAVLYGWRTVGDETFVSMRFRQGIE